MGRPGKIRARKPFQTPAGTSGAPERTRRNRPHQQARGPRDQADRNEPAPQCTESRQRSRPSEPDPQHLSTARTRECLPAPGNAARSPDASKTFPGDAGLLRDAIWASRFPGTQPHPLCFLAGVCAHVLHLGVHLRGPLACTCT